MQGAGGGCEFGFGRLGAEFLDAVVGALDDELGGAAAGVVVGLGLKGAGGGTGASVSIPASLRGRACERRRRGSAAWCVVPSRRRWRRLSTVAAAAARGGGTRRPLSAPPQPATAKAELAQATESAARRLYGRSARASLLRPPRAGAGWDSCVLRGVDAAIVEAGRRSRGCWSSSRCGWSLTASEVAAPGLPWRTCLAIRRIRATSPLIPASHLPRLGFVGGGWGTAASLLLGLFERGGGLGEGVAACFSLSRLTRFLTGFRIAVGGLRLVLQIGSTEAS